MIYKKISGFTDEIDTAFLQQISGAKCADMTYVCLRNVNGKNICDYTPKEAEEQILPLLQLNQIGVSSIGSPIGKITADDEEGFLHQIEQAHRAAGIAQKLNCRYIRIFSFYIPFGDKPEQWKDMIIEKLKKLIEIFSSYGVIALHENEKEIYGDTAERCKYLFDTVDSPYFKGIFDFANFVQCNEDPLRSYELLKNHIEYFHIKDALMASGETVVCGRGDGCIQEILKNAFDTGYNGFLTLEPHLVQFEGLALLERKDVNEIITDKKDFNSLDAFLLQRQSLNRILQSIIQ